MCPHWKRFAFNSIMPMSRYHDMPSEQLEQLRRMIEEMDTIEVIDDDTRELIEKRWPGLLDKIPPKKLS
jgi:hypothetical protein